MKNNQKQNLPKIEYLGNTYYSENRKRKYGTFKCFCGAIFDTRLSNVFSGHSKSCGCLKTKVNKNSQTRLYRIHKGIIQRCSNKNNKAFINYGGRGITICDEWKNDFLSFHDWSLENGYKDNLSIDRIDTNGNYEPNNCRWVNNTIQARNKRILNSNTSGFVGVSQDKRYKNSFRAYLNINKNYIHLGTFCTALEAAQFRDNYILENKTNHTINNV